MPPAVSRCAQCNEVLDAKSETHQCVAALLRRVNQQQIQLDRLRRPAPLRPPLKGVDRSVLPIYLRRF